MRVIAGKARRIQLKSMEGMNPRPTTDRIKETLFNMLSQDIYGCHFLDLFSGSGAIGIEALSRGASQAVFVEKNPNMKLFEMKYGNLTMPIPVKYKTINYFKLIDNTKKNNVDAFKAFKKGRIDMTLNLVEDSLEYLSYVDKM